MSARGCGASGMPSGPIESISARHPLLRVAAFTARLELLHQVAEEIARRAIEQRARSVRSAPTMHVPQHRRRERRRAVERRAPSTPRRLSRLARTEQAAPTSCGRRVATRCESEASAVLASGSARTNSSCHSPCDQRRSSTRPRSRAPAPSTSVAGAYQPSPTKRSVARRCAPRCSRAPPAQLVASTAGRPRRAAASRGPARRTRATTRCATPRTDTARALSLAPPTRPGGAADGGEIRFDRELHRRVGHASRDATGRCSTSAGRRLVRAGRPRE